MLFLEFGEYGEPSGRRRAMNRSLPIIIAGLSMTLLLASVISMDTFSPPDSPSVHPTLSALHVDGARIVDANGHEVTLVGLNYGDHPVNVPALTGDPVVDASKIKGMGFNAVRLVTEWGALENSSSPSDISYNEGNLTLLSRRGVDLTRKRTFANINFPAVPVHPFAYHNPLRLFVTSPYFNVKSDYLRK